jgi:hypothetical protein
MRWILDGFRQSFMRCACGKRHVGFRTFKLAWGQRHYGRGLAR